MSIIIKQAGKLDEPLAKKTENWSVQWRRNNDDHATCGWHRKGMVMETKYECE